MTIKREIGVGLNVFEKSSFERFSKYVNLKLATLGLPYYKNNEADDLDTAWDLIENFREKDRLLSSHLSPVDMRIQNFLDRYFEGEKVPKLPSNTLVLDKYGMARVISLPPNADSFETDTVKSYRIKQGVVHNPKNDRRTTKGSFHIVEGGLPIPFDKIAVPKQAFLKILEAALHPSEDLMRLPYTATQDNEAKTMVSLLLRPTVCPEVPGYIEEKAMEIRFFAPGNLVSNLDFVESIFGNAGDPLLPENDSALHPLNWTGHTGCVILAPQITNLKKKDLGLPHISEATERQKKDGMYWEHEDDIYNNGSPYKITCRTDEGVIVTIIGDNYFGYSKKEVKTQMGYSANLSGLYEEEHAGGALAYTARNLGIQFTKDSSILGNHTFEKAMKILEGKVDIKPEGYAVDKEYPNIIYVPEKSLFSLVDGQSVTWDGGKINLLPDHYYILPSGYKVRMEKHPDSPAWRLVGIDSEGTFCHKPCTVSGGGKSEISKSIWDAITFGPVFVADFKEDMKQVEEIINKDYSDRFKEVWDENHKARPILSEKRSLGSVIRLLSPNEIYSDEYNNWVREIPARIKAVVFLVKRFYQPEWGNDWKSHFSVDFVNGLPGNRLKFNDRYLKASFLRIGRDENGHSRTYKLRQDFLPAEKLQLEDDITSSIVVPSNKLSHLNPMYKNPSVKIAYNSEFRFFQRPDDAIIRGYDKQAEMDLSTEGNFISNYEPLPQEKAQEYINDTIAYYKYTEPVQNLLKEVAESNEYKYFILPSDPRIVNGAPSKNPRYLETQKDLINPLKKYVSVVGARLKREIGFDTPLYNPVNAVLTGRRNNPIDREAGIRPLAVYGPIHYQELPELFMDFICSLTGKSPSTTGAGSEGALTKGPFNALVATSDLNNALLSYIVTGYDGYSSAAGYIGHKYKVDHDISLLVPELWARLTEEERDAKRNIELGYLEPVEDFEYEGRTIKGSILGYRLTRKFTQDFLGKIFDSPESIFPDDMLKPELQDLESFVDGIENITETHAKIGKAYVEDGHVDSAVPPLRALIHIMAEGEYNGMTIHSKEFRDMFEYENVINSDWYKARLLEMQGKSISFFEKSIKNLEDFLKESDNKNQTVVENVKKSLTTVKERLEYFKSDAYVKDLTGTIGADIICK